MPTPPADIDLAALLGEWHIVATTLPFWRGKRAPRIRYTPLPDGRWGDELRWEQPRWWGAVAAKRLAGADTPVDGAPGRFVWRGAGVLGVLASEWCFVEVGPGAAWCATWFARASFGATPEGMDVYARDAGFDPTSAMAGLEARADLPKIPGWYRPER